MFLPADAPDRVVTRVSMSACPREVESGEPALVPGDISGFVIEPEHLLAAEVEDDVRQRRTHTFHFRVVVLLVEVRHRLTDLRDRARGGVMTKSEEGLEILLLTGTQTGHERDLCGERGLWPQAKPVGASERLKKNDLSGRQIVFLQSRTFARRVIQNESICRWGKERNA